MKKRIKLYQLMMLVMMFVMTLSSPFAAEAKKKSSSAEQKILRAPKVEHRGKNREQVTIMVYMNGSNLESDNQAATRDLKEMIKAGDSEQVNVIVQTMGTKKWSKSLGIASNRSQRYRVTGDGLELVGDNLGQLDCTSYKTLQDFEHCT